MHPTPVGFEEVRDFGELKRAIDKATEQKWKGVQNVSLFVPEGITIFFDDAKLDMGFVKGADVNVIVKSSGSGATLDGNWYLQGDEDGFGKDKLSLTLSNFNISARSGNALYIKDYVQLYVSSCHVFYQREGVAKGIFNIGSQAYFEYCSFEGFTGNGQEQDPSANVGANIGDCAANTGCCFRLHHGSFVSLVGCTIRNCDSACGGGAFWIREGSSVAILHNCLISDCSATTTPYASLGGAIYVDAGGSVTMTNTVITGCKGELGGAVGTQDGDLSMDNCIIRSCIAWTGGAILVGQHSKTRSSAKTKLTKLTIIGCTARYGGGLKFENAKSVLMSEVLLINNSAVTSGSAMYMTRNCEVDAILITVQHSCKRWIRAQKLPFTKRPKEYGRQQLAAPIFKIFELGVGKTLLRGLNITAVRDCDDSQPLLDVVGLSGNDARGRGLAAGHIELCSAQSDVCGPEATCIDEPVFMMSGVSEPKHSKLQLTTAGCICVLPNKPHPFSTMSEAATPFQLGCVMETTFDRTIVSTEDVISYATKSQNITQPRTQVNVTLHLRGSDPTAPLEPRWSANLTMLGNFSRAWIGFCQSGAHCDARSSGIETCSMLACSGVMPKAEVVLQRLSSPWSVDIPIFFDVTGLRESELAYQAIVNVEPDAQVSRGGFVTVRFYVNAVVVAAQCHWGEKQALSQYPLGYCTSISATVKAKPMVTVGTPASLPFTACDRDSIPVKTGLPSKDDTRSFTVNVWKVNDPRPIKLNTMNIVYLGDGSYEVRLIFEQHGEFEVQLLLAGEETSSKLIITSSCPPGKDKVDDICGCKPGTQSDGSEGCEPCPAGRFKYSTGDTQCIKCQIGHFQPSERSISCYPVDPGYYQDQPGMTKALPCAPGYFSVSNGSTECIPCAVGHFQPSDSSISCIPVEPGYYQDKLGRTEALSCEPGYFSADLGSTGCIPCNIGHFQPSGRSTSCIPVTPGYYQDKLGQTEALPCEPGYNSSGIRSTKCFPCAVGHFQSSEGSISCNPVDPGYYQDKVGQTEALPCEPGYFSASIGSHKCFPCRLGYFTSTPATASCTACPIGSFAENEGATKCAQCEPHTTSTEGGISCAMCSASFYLQDTSLSPSMRSCLSCPSGAFCPKNTTLATLYLQTGWWRISSKTDTLYECANSPSDCNVQALLLHNCHVDATSEQCRKCADSSNTPCIGGQHVGFEGEGYCFDDEHIGVKCQVCSKDMYHFNQETGRCEQCDNTAFAVFKLALVLVGLVLAVKLLRYIAANHWTPKQRTHCQGILVGMRSIALKFYLWGMQPKLKGFLTCYQVVSIMTVEDIYGLRMPSKLSWLIDVLQWPEVFGVQLFIKEGCYSSALNRLLVVTLWPLILILGIVVSSVLWELCSMGLNKVPGICQFGKRLERFGRVAKKVLAAREPSEMRSVAMRAATGRPTGPTCIEAMRCGLIRALPVVLLITFYYVPVASARIFKTFACTTIEVESKVISGQSAIKRQFLADELSIDCSSSEYQQLLSWAYVLLAIWPVGVPIFYTGLLLANRKSIIHHTPTVLSRATSFLWSEYKTDLFMWEPFALLHKVAITGFVLLTSYVGGRVLIAIFLCLIALVAYAVLTPFKRPEDNWIFDGIHLTLLMLFVAGLALQACEFPDSNFCSTLGLGDSSFGIAITFISITLFLNLLGIVLVVTFFITQSKASHPIMLRQDMIRPQLSLKIGLMFHLFLSHTWKSGQDQVAVIKRQLQLILPGVSVFLDVDDLENIRDLELHIKQSQAILAFLSKHYFSQRNCLREVSTAVEEKKPIVAVHEAEISKGGVDLQECIADCPTKYKDFIFPPGKPPITWQRIKEFHLFSLKLIAHELLCHCPTFVRKDLNEKDLFFINEEPIEELKLNGGRWLHVSEHNLGAKNEADKLASIFWEQLNVNVLGGNANSGTDKANSSTMTRLTDSVLRKSISGSTWSKSSVNMKPLHRLSRRYRRRNIVNDDTTDFFLLYLNSETFKTGNQELEDVLHEIFAEPMVKIIMLHERDQDLGGCEFDLIYAATPVALLDAGLYDDIAISMFPGQHRKVSYSVVAKGLGARMPKRKSSYFVEFDKLTEKLTRVDKPSCVSTTDSGYYPGAFEESASRRI